MKVAIMQPYFFPYIAYWQLINAVDRFVIYDNIQFTKNSWIRRNRILFNGKDRMFSLPLKKDSDYLDVRDRKLAQSFESERIKILNKIKYAYKNAPQYHNVIPIIEDCLFYQNENLFEYINYSVSKVLEYLHINTDIVISSNLNIDKTLKGKDRVIEICKNLGADVYINPIGGIDLYDKKEFLQNGLALKFLSTKSFEYTQYNHSFVPKLSIIDVMMFKSVHEVRELLEEFELL